MVTGSDGFQKNRSSAHSTINHESLADNGSQNDIEYLYEALDYVAKGKVKVMTETLIR